MAERIKMVKYLDSYSVPDFDIRPVDTEQLREIATIMYEAYEGTPDYEGESVNDFSKELSMVFRDYFGTYLKDASMVLYDEDEKPAAFMFVCEYKKEPTLTYMFTRKNRLGRGYAKALMQAAEISLRYMGYEHISLYVSKDNIPALNLYLKHGFMEIPLNSTAIDRDSLEEIREWELSSILAEKDTV